MYLFLVLKEINFIKKKIFIFFIKILSRVVPIPNQLLNIVERQENYFKLKSNTIKYNKYFTNLKLKNIKNLYLILDPMPSKKFLKKYYQETYWQYRGDSNELLRYRDFDHFKSIGSKLKSNSSVLNFGSGHGGISILLRAQNHSIINFDLFKNNNNFFQNKYSNIDTLTKIKSKIDFIYASHALEHVHSIKETLKDFLRISHSGTRYFFEVPNCTNYTEKNTTDIPHTHYFSVNFFNKIFKKKINSFFYCNIINNYKKNGSVIRVFTNRKLVNL